MKRLAIVGASGHGRVVADTAELCGWEQIHFFDDAYPRVIANAAWPVQGTFQDLLLRLATFDGVVVAIGNNKVRLAKLKALLLQGGRLTTLVHPTACISHYARIGDGSVVLAGAAVNAYAKTGLGCILNTQCSVDHDCLLGDAVHVSPGAHLAGGVWVGETSWIGIGACVRQMIHIGDGVTVGAGAAVVKNVPDNVTVVGVPAHL